MLRKLKAIAHTLHALPINKLALGIIVVAGVAAIGTLMISITHAATSAVSTEAESGTVTSCAAIVTDNSASSKSAVKFGTCVASPTPANESADAGAALPISYNLASLTGAVVYVSPSGSDAGNGSVSSPYATLAKALSVVPAGGNIVLRGGTYHEGNFSLGKSVKVVAYPGETPVFNGAEPVSGGWTNSGTTSYRSYTPMPVTDGSGITFTTCLNLSASCVGKYPDQAWIGTNQITQVNTLAEVTDGKFYVDHTNNRMYLDNTDIAKGSVEISGIRKFASVSAPNVTLSGFKVIRFSNTASDYGVINFVGTADNALVDNLFISDAAFISMNFGPSGSDLNNNSTVQNSTIQDSNWMGVTALATNYFKLEHNNINNLNPAGEFATSPQSGALKTSRTWYTQVLNNKIMNNNSQGIWFDQSNYKAEVAGNDIENNAGTGLFYEISDFIYIVNNYIKATGGSRAVKLAAASNTYMVNNTVIGGADPVGVYVDSRSIPGCSTATPAPCGPYAAADGDSYHAHPATLSWIPSINLYMNNIFAYPTATGYCGVTTALCVTQTNATATVAITSVIHGADPANGVPQTFMDHNVYANGAGTAIKLNALGGYSTTSAFMAALTGSPVNIGGLEAHGLVGNSYVASDGTPTSALSALHGSAMGVPSDATINKYLPVGTKHYGVTWR